MLQGSHWGSRMINQCKKCGYNLYPPMSFFENWTLRPPTASKLKRRSSHFFILVLYTKFHSNPMMGTPSNSNFLSWNLAFSSNFCCGRKKPKTTNALFEWFRLKIKGATLETNSFFLKMVILKNFFQTRNQLI